MALISSAGVALNDDRPFDQEAERRNPGWGDPSYRVLPTTATDRDVTVYHLHIDPRLAQADLNCILPLQRLAERADQDVIGRAAPRHYSFGRTLGQPGDAAGQTGVLRATLCALARMDHRGAVCDLLFEWPEPPKLARAHPPCPPPIVAHLRRCPWALPRLLLREPPADQDNCHVK